MSGSAAERRRADPKRVVAELEQLPVTIETDEAGNVWATLRGRSPRSLTIGSHLDSVPDGGWLDGCLGVVCGLEVLRALAADPDPPVTIRLVDWADEEGPVSVAVCSARVQRRDCWTPSRSAT